MGANSDPCLEALRQVHFENIALDDILARALHSLDVLIPGEIGLHGSARPPACSFGNRRRPVGANAELVLQFCQAKGGSSLPRPLFTLWEPRRYHVCFPLLLVEHKPSIVE